MPKKSKYYSYNSPKRRRMRLLYIGLMLLLAGIAIITIYIWRTYESNLQPVSGSSSPVVVAIPKGSSLPQIATILKKDGVIKSVWAFEWYVRNDNYARTSLEAGTYIFHPNQSVQNIVSILSQGKASGKLVVILPGQRIDQIESALINDGFPRNQVIAALGPNQYISKYSMLTSLPQTATLEGFLYPDSFARDSSTTVSMIINESLTEMQSKLTLDIINGFNKQGLTIYQGVTLSSLVEQEVSNLKDKPIVAQVFLSRLQAGMNLGSDASAFYGAIVAGQTPSINYDSIYNTRLHPGLPFGPISNVTQDSMLAVAHPANTNYLYFVTGDNGVTYYSTSLDSHNQQIQQYCKKLCASE